MPQISPRISTEARDLLKELQTLMVEGWRGKLSQGEVLEQLIRDEHQALTTEEAHDEHG
jgi:hypothetical protein